MNLKWTFFITVCFVLITPAGLIAADREIKIATQPMGHQLSSETMPYVQCAMDIIGKPYVIIQGPWERAQRATENGTYDGFFIATQNKKRNAYAAFSRPFYSIKWLYVVRSNSGVTPSDGDFFSSLKFAADIGSARLILLEEKRKKGEIVNDIVRVEQPEQAIKMLASNRVDVVLINDHYWERSTAGLSLNPNDFNTFVMRDTPASVYWSKKLFLEYPGFLDDFNSAMLKCK